MTTPGTSSGTSIEALFGTRTMTIVPDVLAPAAAAQVRAALAPGFVRYDLLDRGSYEHQAPTLPPALATQLVELATGITGRTLAISCVRALRLRAGDYLLAHHDRVYDDLPLELIVDASAAPVPGAEVHVRRRGQVFFRVPSAPGAVALVERGPTVTTNHTYVSRRFADAEVVRLHVLLRGPA